MRAGGDERGIAGIISYDYICEDTKRILMISDRNDNIWKTTDRKTGRHLCGGGP